MPTTPKTPTPKPAEAAVHETLHQALAAFQANLPTVSKGNTAQVRSDRGNYSYGYADLADITEVVLPALGAQGLSWTTIPTLVDGQFVLRYALTHGATGEAIEGLWPLPDPTRTAAQQVGSATTYAKRYALCAVTGVAPNDGSDDDGAQASNAAHQARQQAPRQQAPVQRQAPQQAAIQQAPAAEPDYLPEGIYDLAAVTTSDDARTMFYAARAAGHLNLALRIGDRDVLLGDHLRQTGAALEAAEAVDPDSAAIAAHEAELAAVPDEDKPF